MEVWCHVVTEVHEGQTDNTELIYNIDYYLWALCMQFYIKASKLAKLWTDEYVTWLFKDRKTPYPRDWVVWLPIINFDGSLFIGFGGEICRESDKCVFPNMHSFYTLCGTNTQNSMFFKLSFLIFGLLFVSCAGCDPYYNACNPQLFQ